MSDVKRPYRSPRRQAQARRTRERIVDAARHLWVERGFGATTMETIAAEADVAVQTVYAAFGSKGGILTDLLGRLEAQAGGERLMDDLAAAPSPIAQVEVVAGFNRRLFEGGADILAIALGTTAVDPEVAQWAAEGDRRRREGQARIVAGWRKSAVLAVSAEEALDILYALTGPELFLLLVARLGWAPSRYERWLADALVAFLFRRADT